MRKPGASQLIPMVAQGGMLQQIMQYLLAQQGAGAPAPEGPIESEPGE